MSKFLLNLLVQIFKAMLYSKIKFYSEKNFSVAFGPSGLSAQLQPTCFFQPAIPPLPTGPRPIKRPSSPSRPSQPRTGGALPTCRLPHGKTPPAAPPLPSPRPADRWAPPAIPHLWLRSSSAAPPPPPATPHDAQLHTSGCRRAVTRPTITSPT
jgi:hypothetical protein